MLRFPGRRLAERVPDLDAGKTPDLRDLASGNRMDIAGAAVPEHTDRRDLASALGVDQNPVPGPQRSREHPGVGDLLPRRAALDLEHRSGNRAFRLRLPVRRGKQARDARSKRTDARAGHRRAGEHRVHHAAPGLRREHRCQPVIGQPGLVVDVIGEQGFIPLGEQVGQAGCEGRVAWPVGSDAGFTGALAAGPSHRDDRRREPV